MNPPHREPGGLTLRRILAAALGGVAAYVAGMALLVTLVILPRITTLRADTQAFLTELNGYAREAARLDSAVVAARRALAQNNIAGATFLIRTVQEAPVTSLARSGARAVVDAPTEMRSALSQASDLETYLRDYLSEGTAYLELGRTELADSTLARADSVARELTAQLARAHQAGLQDLARRGVLLEETVGTASGVFLLWSGMGLLFVAIVGLLIHRRLYRPLHSLDHAMRALSEGDLDASVDVRYPDEMGRLAALFNQTAQVLRAREVERRSERKVMTQRILESVLDAVITVDLYGNVTGWNPSAEEIFGWSADEMLGQPLDPILPLGNQTSPRDIVLKSQGLADVPTLRSRLELPVLRRDGSQFTAEVSVVPIVEEGRKVAYTAFLRDVTEQRRAEAAVRRSEKLLRAILDNSSAIVIVKDMQGRYLLVNRRFGELTGIDPEEVQGKTADEVAPGSTGQSAARHDAEVIRLRKSVQFDEVLELPGGRRHFLTVRFPLLDEAGEPYGVAGISTDITESIEMEERARRSQRLEAVGRLAGGIAHDFNNLVTIILAQTQLTLEEDLSANVAAGLLEIEKAAGRAGDLTGQLLAFARKQIISPEEVRVNDLVQDTLGMLHRVIEATVHVETQLDPEAGCVHVDRGHFSQVLLNLVINARDAMGPAGGTVTLRTGTSDEAPEELPEGRYVLLTLEDDGPGIPEEVLPRVFEPFYTTKPMGTGLGLATCHGIVSQAGGAIQAGNREEGGARFRVWLPALDSDA